MLENFKTNKTKTNKIIKTIYKKSKLSKSKTIKQKTANSKTNKTNKTKKCFSFEKLKNLTHYNSDYLKNKICKLIPLFEFNPNIKKNIVSACFFKLRKGSYKNFNKYLNGVALLYKIVNEQLPNFTLRLFIDMSIYNDKNIMNILNKLNNIDLVLYCCKVYERDDIYHLGTFGTMLRAFPLFDFPNNDANRVIIVDIDITVDKQDSIFKSYTELVKIYTDDELDTLYIYGSGKPYMVLNNKKYIIDDKYIKPYFIIDRIIGFKKLPCHIINSFLYNMAITRKTYSTYHINKVDKAKKCDEYICFGIDEYLINDIVIPYLLKNKYSLLFLVNCNLQSTIYNFNDKLYSNLKSKFNSYIKFLTHNIDKNKFKINTIEKQIYFINNIFYDKNSVIKQSKITNIHKLLIKNYYDLLYNLYKRKDFTIFNKDMIDIALSKDMIGYFKKVKYISYNNNLKHIVLDDKSVNTNMTPDDINKYHSVVSPKRQNLIF